MSAGPRLPRAARAAYATHRLRRAPGRPAPMSAAGSPAVAPLALLLALLCACAPRERDHVVQDVRPGAGGEVPRLGASSAERFGLSDEPSTLPIPRAFEFSLPDGWEQRPPSPGKEVDLRAPGEVAVWVSRLAGRGGGLLPNLTRWRAQLGLGPADDAMVEDAERVPLLGADACRFDLTDADGGRRMIGLMSIRSTSSVFVRISGPSAAVGAQLEAFDRFVDSLDEAPRSGPGAEAAGRAAAGGLSWSAPASWFALSPGTFQLARFRVDDGVEAWLSVLAGDGGGIAANVTRWCEQYGREPLDAAAIRDLPRIPLLGTDALVVDLAGDRDGDGRGMLGVVCELPGRAVFVKMDGPAAAVRAHASAFREFCASLELDG